MINCNAQGNVHTNKGHPIMLVLSRKLNDTICIGDDIVVKVVKIRGNVVGLGIVAPVDIKVMRAELLEKDRLKSAQEPSRSKSSRPALSVVRSLPESVKDSGKAHATESAMDLGKASIAEDGKDFVSFHEHSSKGWTHIAMN